jgi:hypothetical protein
MDLAGSESREKNDATQNHREVCDGHVPRGRSRSIGAVGMSFVKHLVWRCHRRRRPTDVAPAAVDWLRGAELAASAQRKATTTTTTTAIAIAAAATD